MKTDTLIKNEGMEILTKYLGMVEAERFIMLIQREPFDYTKWQENLFEDMTIEELSKKADEYVKNNNV
jgi:dephospho-CoA kinase